MKVTDRTLTAVTAICLALGVGVAGYFIRDDGHDQTASYTPNLIKAPANKPKVFASLQPLQNPQNNASGLIAMNVQTDAPTLAALVNPPRRKPLQETLSPIPLLAALPPRFLTTTPKGTLPVLQTQFPTSLCSINLRAQTKPAARVKLWLDAPCQPDSTVTIEHAGLQFREKLNADGNLTLVIPAFAEFSKFDVTFRGGLRASTGVYIAGLSALNRAGISFAGQNPISLNAYDSRVSGGKVSLQNARSYTQSLLSGGGYLTLLGNTDLPDPVFTQIYTQPNPTTDRQDYVRLEIETQQTDTICDRMLEIQTAHKGGVQRKLKIRVADCSTENRSLVLKNIFKNMRMTESFH